MATLIIIVVKISDLPDLKHILDYNVLLGVQCYESSYGTLLCKERCHSESV